MKYKGKTVVSLAHERGASGNIKKRESAWNYLISGIKTNTIPVEKRGDKYHKYSTEGKKRYIRDAWTKRVQESAWDIVHMHGYETREESSRRLVAAGEYTEDALLVEHVRIREATAVAFRKFKKVFTLAGFPRTPQAWDESDSILKIGGRYIQFSRMDSASWSGKYKSGRWPDSKSISRYAILLREDASCLSPHTLLTATASSYYGEMIEEKRISYEARGRWLEKAIIELLEISPMSVRGKARIQLDAHCRIKLLRKIGVVEIWGRTLAGEVLDYCAARGKDTYHAATQKEAVRGLSAKLAAPGTRREKIDMDYAIALGFCRSGVEQFCDDYALDAEKNYTRAEIQAIIVSGNGRAEKYSRELEKAGFTH